MYWPLILERAWTLLCQVNSVYLWNNSSTHYESKSLNAQRTVAVRKNFKGKLIYTGFEGLWIGCGTFFYAVTVHEQRRVRLKISSEVQFFSAIAGITSNPADFFVSDLLKIFWICLTSNKLYETGTTKRKRRSGYWIHRVVVSKSFTNTSSFTLEGDIWRIFFSRTHREISQKYHKYNQAYKNAEKKLVDRNIVHAKEKLILIT